MSCRRCNSARATRASRSRGSAIRRRPTPQQLAARCEDCWCAACARGGTVRPSGPRRRGAVADGVDVVVARGLQRVAHHQLVEPVGFEPADVLPGHPAPSTPAAHTINSARTSVPLARRTPSRQHLAPPCRCGRAPSGLRAASAAACASRSGSGRQDAGRGLDQVDLDLLVRVDARGRRRRATRWCCAARRRAPRRSRRRRRWRCDCSARIGSAKLARKHAFTSRRWNGRACPAVSSVKACSCTPGVLKSLDWQPMAITSLS